MNLTAEEEEIADFSSDEFADATPMVEWALVGKVLSLTSVHVNTVPAVMRPAWGNPFGLKLRSIGEKKDNLFVVEFGSQEDMARVLAGSLWMVGKHAVLLQLYDERLSAVEILFETLEIWV
ncbi:hypothetical protein QOZ80_5BG0431770 [Eleusine coracana subsp. coracana]|nr:hypothetical protein QOZ80_5BG0431770 [Eleusine coracana subsp. coracana]